MSTIPNPRKNSYGFTVRIDCGTDLSGFTGQTGRDISIYCSASSNGGFRLNVSASTAFVGNSTIYSSAEGLTFQSAQWVYGQMLTADAFATADTYNLWVVASATGKHFISPVQTITVDS